MQGNIALLVPAGIFIWAGGAKIVGLGPQEYALIGPLALKSLGLVEVLVGVLLLRDCTCVVAARYASGLAVGFLAIALWDLTSPDAPPCGCFGGIEVPAWGRVAVLIGMLLITFPIAGMRYDRRLWMRS